MKQKKRAIVILSGGIKQNSKGQWVSTDIIEDEGFQGALRGKIRVIAASYLFKEDPSQIIIASGGHGYDLNVMGIEHPGLSKILKREAIELGVPANKIIEESKSNNTFEQLLELDKTINKGKIDEIKIISTVTHIERIKTMIEYIPPLNRLNRLLESGLLKFQAAEDILLKYEPKKWGKIIDKANRSKQAKETVRLEKNGIMQIKKGTYKFIKNYGNKN